MGDQTRYELLEKIGTGSFATVYRARDNELGREVAVKEIHAQFREEPKTLERYWSEAQLLASLPHPNIVTIFDLERDRGWLIMELMQANLADRMAERQMNLRSLRTTLAHCLRALKYLHARGIVHGDIKPANMMIDSRKRIKIGDFGLARRVSDEEGSLLKGTTKYMAPEVVSDEFGDVTAASDLYSLGFSAYELMCGRSNFEDLFPGLSAFGRDKQAAWMMWHAAPDRRLPEIKRTLKGVPEDLAHVIEKLTEKDPKKRYQTADEALSDLEIDVKLVGEKTNDAEGATKAAAPEKEGGDKKRVMVIAAVFAASLIMSLFMFFQDATPDPLGDPKKTALVGIIRKINLDEKKVVIEDPEKGIPEEISLGKKPRVYFENEKKNILLRELHVGDRVEIRKETEKNGSNRYRIVAARPITSEGLLKIIDVVEKRIVIAINKGTVRDDIQIRVPERAKLLLNGKESSLSRLMREDRVTVTHLLPPGGKGTLELVRLDALRNVNEHGYLSEYDAASQKLHIRFGKGHSAGNETYTVAKDCKVKRQNGTPLELSNLKKGDRVDLTLDSEVHSILVTRASKQLNGSIKKVSSIEKIATVQDGQGNLHQISLASDGQVTLGLDHVALVDLREFDAVEILYNEEGGKLVAKVIDASRPKRHDRWAVIIGTEAYKEKLLSPIPFATDNAHLIAQTLQRRYAFSEGRISVLQDKTLEQWKIQIKDTLGFASKSPAQVILVISGHAYLSPEGEPYFAPVDFKWDDMENTGLSFRWLIEQFNACQSKDKILIYDATHTGTGKDLKKELSAKTMFSKVNLPRNFSIIACCDDGQRSYPWEDKRISLFSYAVSQAFGGEADTNLDTHLTPKELIKYLEKQFPTSHLPAGTTQTPVLIKKNN